MKKFFGKIKNWFIRHKPSKRGLIQLYSALLFNANLKGFFSGKISSSSSKAVCIPGFNCYSCPGAVGACPLGSLQNALGSSNTSMIAYVFGILILFGLLLGRVICGFLCPMGLVQDLLYKIKSPKLQKNRVTRILSYFKYVLLLVLVILLPLVFAGHVVLPAFCQFICPVGTIAGLFGLSNPANSGDLASLWVLFTWKFILLVLILIGSIFIYRLFCRFLCPLGALYSFFCKLAMLGIKLDKQKCIDCGLCIQTCKMDIRHVGDHECIHCGACIPVCPTKAISWKGGKLFVEANEVSPQAREGETVKLSDVMESQKRLFAAQSANVEAEAQTAQETPQTGEEVACTAQSEQKPNLFKRAWKKLQKRNGLGFQIIAWSLALVLLVGALVYFNFIHEEVEASNRYEVGDTVSDFEVIRYFSGEGATYKLSDDLAEGKIVVLNFWYITCGGCEHEIPYFGALAQKDKYKDKVSVVIMHSNNEIYGANANITYENQQMKGLEKYVVYNKASANWTDFYQDVKWTLDLNGSNSLYLQFGGNGAWPMTAILDGAGKVRYITAAAMDESSLQQEVDKILQG